MITHTSRRFSPTMNANANTDTPYSLENPPQAPKAKRLSLEERRRRRANLEKVPKLQLPKAGEEKPEWRVLAESGQVRAKYLQYTPEDISEIDDLDTLLWLHKCYHPASQPVTFIEHAYVDLMAEAIDTRLYHL